MKMYELKNAFEKGQINKKLYWTLMRDNYSSIIPQLQQMVKDGADCDSIVISEEGSYLKKKNGVKLFFDFSQTICRAEGDLFMGEDYEKNEMNYIGEYLKQCDCLNVLDIGGNVGSFSLDLSAVEDSLTFHIFEPIPNTYNKLLANIKLNEKEESKFNTYNIGLSDKAGSFDFYLPATDEAASMQPIEDSFYRKGSNEMGEYTGKDKMEKVVCLVDTVDNIVSSKGIDNIGFIKIDVEGNEKFVLQGAKETLSKFKPLVYCELLRIHSARFGYHPNEVIDYMTEFGYKCYVMKDKELIKIDKITEETVETNFFFKC